MNFTDEIITEIKLRNRIEDVISNYVELKLRGGNFVGICPFHKEKTASFTVYPKTQSFYCFGCGIGGGAIDFIMHKENLDYGEAVKFLAEKSGIILDEFDANKELNNGKNKLYAINQEAARFYYYHLMNDDGKIAMNYLTERGLDLHTIKGFGLGYAMDGWDLLLKHLKSKGYTIGEMMEAKLIAKSQKGRYYDVFRDRIIYPIFSINGKIVGFSGRRLSDSRKDVPKYLNSAETIVFKKRENLYGLKFAKNSSEQNTILVEGNMDVMTLYKFGFTNAVAALGTSFTEEQAQVLSGITKEVIIIMDADEAGKKSVNKATDILKKINLSYKIVSLPDCMDPDEYIKTYGADKFKILLEKAENPLEYKLNQLRARYDFENDNDILKFLSESITVIGSEDEILVRDFYIGKISKEFDISRKVFENEVEKYINVKIEV